jgi:DNA modification methylase
MCKLFDENRNFIAMEINPEYIRITNSRMTEIQLQLPLNRNACSNQRSLNEDKC